MTRLEEIEERYNDVLDPSLPSKARDTRICKLVNEDIPFLIEQIASLERDNEILRNMNKILKESVKALAADRDRLREEMPCRRCGIRKYGYCEECKTLQGEEEEK